jgi:hypothetical protein
MRCTSTSEPRKIGVVEQSHAYAEELHRRARQAQSSVIRSEIRSRAELSCSLPLFQPVHATSPSQAGSSLRRTRSDCGFDRAHQENCIESESDGYPSRHEACQTLDDWRLRADRHRARRCRRRPNALASANCRYRVGLADAKGVALRLGIDREAGQCGLVRSSRTTT